MNVNLTEFRYCEGYYFANVISNVLDDPSPYLTNLDEFWGSHIIYNLLQPYRKFSALHSFIDIIVGSIYLEELSRDDSHKIKARINDKYRTSSHWIPIEKSLKLYEIDHKSFQGWLTENNIGINGIDYNSILSYFNHLDKSQSLNKLIKKVTEEVFFIVFSNRNLLYNFNSNLSQKLDWIINYSNLEDTNNLFTINKRLKRKNPPQWAKRAVFHRDHGRCVACNKDLSNLITQQNKIHFDHIIPLANCGLNDISNLQLLCEECNLSKSAKDSIPYNFYEKWY